MIEFESKYGCIVYGDASFCIQEIDDEELNDTSYQEYGTDLPDDQAFELASNLVNLYRSVYLVENKNISQNYETKLQSTHHQN